MLHLIRGHITPLHTLNTANKPAYLCEMTICVMTIIHTTSLLKITESSTAPDTAASLSLNVSYIGENKPDLTQCKHKTKQAHLISKVLDNEGAVRHAWLLKEGAGL